MSYQSEFLVVSEKSVVAMRFIESMGFPDGEDLVIAKLRDDLEIEIVMCSGKEYVISTRAQYPKDSYWIKLDGIDSARLTILNKWKDILTGKS